MTKVKQQSAKTGCPAFIGMISPSAHRSMQGPSENCKRTKSVKRDTAKHISLISSAVLFSSEGFSEVKLGTVILLVLFVISDFTFSALCNLQTIPAVWSRSLLALRQHFCTEDGNPWQKWAGSILPTFYWWQREVKCELMTFDWAVIDVGTLPSCSQLLCLRLIQPLTPHTCSLCRIWSAVLSFSCSGTFCAKLRDDVTEGHVAVVLYFCSGTHLSTS